jgi:hypothetical protein
LYIVVPDMLGSSDITSVLSRTHIVSANMVVGKRKITANKNFFIFILLRLEKRPPEKYGGQEVQNNQMNCVAYSIYSQTLLTVWSGVFSSQDTKKHTTRCIIFPSVDASCNGSSHPIITKS